MTDDQAREWFGAAMDGELEASEMEAFEAHLATHPQLAKEYSAFQNTLAKMASVHQAVNVPDLLPGVQKKLRQRGRGGLGDGTAQLRGKGFLTPMSLGLMLAALLVIVWLALRLMMDFNP